MATIKTLHMCYSFSIRGESPPFAPALLGKLECSGAESAGVAGQKRHTILTFNLENCPLPLIYFHYCQLFSWRLVQSAEASNLMSYYPRGDFTSCPETSGDISILKRRKNQIKRLYVPGLGGFWQLKTL